MRAIFVSYRRDDSEGEAGRLFDDLVGVFGENSVFMDVAAIEVGRDFRKAIDDSVATCGVLLAVIGKEWTDAKNEAGQRRLDDPSDFVRLETASALRRDIPVVPVLVHGAKMPRPEQLPDDLKELAYRNGVELTHVRWNSDLQLLIKALRRYVEDPKTSTAGAGPAAAGATAVTGSTVRASQTTHATQVDTRTSPTARKKPLGKILALVAAAVVAIIIVASIMTPAQISVPDLGGSTLADATTKLESLHLTVGQKTLREDSTKDPNIVLSQSPSPNTRVKSGSTVDLVLSQASAVEVPPLVGETLDDARRTLADRQLHVGSIERQPKAGVARDTVLHEFPSAGEKVKGGSKVDLMVSDVPENTAAEATGGGSQRKAPGPAPSEKVPASSNARQVQPSTEQSTAAASQSRPVQNEPPAEAVKPIPQVVNVAGIWHDTTGTTFRVTQRGNTFTYTASSPSGISEGGGTISGLEFEGYYRTAYVNGARSQGRCTGAIAGDGSMIRSSCLDSVYGATTNVLSR
jgi:beta-lactam-binding protein with PASTA domain